MSSNEGNESWRPVNKAGLAIGFIVFGCAYLFTIVKIFLDIKQRGEGYDEDIAEDLR